MLASVVLTVFPTVVLDANFGYTRQYLGAVHQPDIDAGNFGLKVGYSRYERG
jgi:hypothetical protein